MEKTEWTFKEFANLQGINYDTLRQNIKRGRLPEGYEIREINSRVKMITLSTKSCPAANNCVTEADRLTGYARSTVLDEWLSLRERYGNKKEADMQFLHDFNNLKRYIHLNMWVENITLKTLYRWHKLRAAGGVNLLIPNRSGQRDTLVTKEEEEILLRYYLSPNKPTAEECIRYCINEIEDLGITPKSNRTYRRLLDKYVQHNYAEVTYIREGYKAFKDKVIPDISRDLTQIETGDVVEMDGHILDFQIINPATGRPERMMMTATKDMRSGVILGWSIMPTENTYSVMSALRTAIATLGFKPRVVRIDNGKAFRSRAFSGGRFDPVRAGEINSGEVVIKGALQRLGIAVSFAKPYSGQSKTIEMSFRLFSELERRMHTYVGNTIDNKPARLRRNEKLHKEAFEKENEMNGAITLARVNDLIHDFYADYNNRLIKSGEFKGMTRWQNYLESLQRVRTMDDYEMRIASDEELTDLMMIEEERTLQKNGVSLLGRTYWMDTFFHMAKGIRLRVRYDLNENDRVMIYDLQGICLGEARAAGRLHPMASILGSEEDQKRLAEEIEIRENLAAPVRAKVKTLLNKGYDPAKAESVIKQREETKQMKKRKATQKAIQTHEEHAMSMEELLNGIALTPAEQYELRQRSLRNAI